MELSPYPDSIRGTGMQCSRDDLLRHCLTGRWSKVLTEFGENGIRFDRDRGERCSSVVAFPNEDNTVWSAAMWFSHSEDPHLAKLALMVAMASEPPATAITINVSRGMEIQLDRGNTEIAGSPEASMMWMLDVLAGSSGTDVEK